MCKQHHLAVGVNIGAFFSDDAQTVTIAIKGQAYFSITVCQSGNHILQIFGFARVGVVVGEVAIHFTEQLDHLAAYGAEDSGCRGTGHTIATVHHNLHGARQLDVAHDARGVGGQHVGALALAAGLQRPALSFHHLAQGLDVITINGAATQHHLETVVVLGVVTARDLDTAVAQRVGREIQHGRGDHAHIDDRDACVLQTVHQSLGQAGAAKTPVSAHGHGFLALRKCHRAKGTAQGASHLGRHRTGHDAANVIGFENTGGDLHFWVPLGEC